MESCASILVSNIKHWGINHIFGIPGKAISPIIFATDQQDVEFVLTKHETGAGFLAAGYALMNHKIGVAVGTSGPGGTNLLTAAGQAKASNLPVLFITGHPSVTDTGKGMGQDSSVFGTDLVEMFRHVTKFSIRVDRGDKLELYLKHAIEKALSGVRGPVHLSIPFDVLQEEVEPFLLDLPIESEMVSPKLNKVIDLLRESEKPLLFLGKGIHSSRAYNEVRCFAEQWNIPVITTPGGKGTFISNHKLSLGAFGLGGTKEASNYLEQGVDLLIVIGTKLSDMSLAGFSKEMFPKQVIQFDYDPTFIGKSLPVPTISILGDIRSNLKLLISNSFKSDIDFITTKHKNSVEMNAAGVLMSSETAVKVIRNQLPDKAILFGDDGSHTFYAIRHYDIYEPGTFFFDDIFGAMGHGIGYSIGAKLANPSQPIICLAGDGCVFMHGTEISTAFNYQSPVLFIILNNGRLDMVEKGMKKMIGKSIGAIYDTPLDASLFANSMGLQSFKCFNPHQLEDSISQALQIISDKNEPVLIEVMVDQDEIPPTMGRQ